jgi:hypothetical protein
MASCGIMSRHEDFHLSGDGSSSSKECGEQLSVMQIYLRKFAVGLKGGLYKFVK